MTSLVLVIGMLLAGPSQEGSSADMEPPPSTAAKEKLDAARRGGLLFDVYCTSCHGEQGQGDGPMAKAIVPPAPDLTSLSRENDGRFPLRRVKQSIDGRRLIPGHREGDSRSGVSRYRKPTRITTRRMPFRKR